MNFRPPAPITTVLDPLTRAAFAADDGLPYLARKLAAEARLALLGGFPEPSPLADALAAVLAEVEATAETAALS